MSEDDGRPVILGIGGTLVPNSSSEKALRISLAAAEREGAEVLSVTGPELVLPMYDPKQEETPAIAALVAAFRRADGIIISSPAYHGSVSGLIKNALDYAEALRGDPRPYFDGRPVGLISCAAGWQGAGQTLSAQRAIVHALRGWPTPLGAVVNTAQPVFDQEGACTDLSVKMQLEMVGQQVVQFCRWRRSAAEAMENVAL